MDNLQRLIQLAKADGGKFFVIDEQGNPVLVIMGVDEYEGVLLRRIKNQTEDLEEVNRNIVSAQEEDAKTRHQAMQDQLKSEVIDSTFEFEPSGTPDSPAFESLEDI